MKGVGFNVNFQGSIVPAQYLGMFKRAVSLINSAEHFEDSVRGYCAEVRMTPKVVKLAEAMGCHRRIDVVSYVEKLGNIVIEATKELNSILSQAHFKRGGEADISEMQYSLIETVNEIYYLSMDEQKQVNEFVKKIVEGRNGTKN